MVSRHGPELASPSLRALTDECHPTIIFSDETSDSGPQPGRDYRKKFLVCLPAHDSLDSQGESSLVNQVDTTILLMLLTFKVAVHVGARACNVNAWYQMNEQKKRQTNPF